MKKTAFQLLAKGTTAMCRMIGYTLFWIAVGMALELLIENIVISVILIFSFLLIGYNLFVC